MKKLIIRLNEEFLKTTDTLWDNEVKANIFLARILLETAILDLIFMILSWMGILTLDFKMVTGVLFQAFLELLAAAFICFHFKGKKRWLKLVLLLTYTLVLARVTMILTHNVILAMVFPIVVSVRYYSRPLTALIGVMSILQFTLADWASVYFKTGIVNLNILRLNEGTTLYFDSLQRLREVVMTQAEIDYADLWRQMFRHYDLPKMILFVMIFWICCEIAHKGREVIMAQIEETSKTERISTELNLASSIQADMLPSLFPAFPEKEEFDIFATMSPAKEVGGDFYDFFLIGEDKLAIEIADVSGKGIPAALFMVIAKTLLKDHTQLSLSPGKVLTTVNNILCENNQAGLFVTAWLGIIDLNTGELTYSNAGHNPPIITHDGVAAYLDQKPGFVLAGLEDYTYKETKMKLAQGDRLFLYTDGATEAMNKDNALYGEDRLLSCIQANTNETSRKVIDAVTEDINNYVAEAEQFDDLTMLAFTYNGEGSDKILHKEVKVTSDSIPEVLDYIKEELESLEVDEKDIYKIILAAEEVYVNICSYAYETGSGDASIDIIINKKKIAIRFTDSGIEFNPLKKEDPDVTKPVEERQIGGLGIFLTKKIMDECTYQRINNQNVFTMSKLRS